MIKPESYSEEHIRKLQEDSKRDPVLLERTIYAFGLLEALARVDLPFIFKGGTCLMLLMNHPKRLSTDIDIIVEPETDLDLYLQKAAGIFPFEEIEEQKRVGRNNIVKRHFKFTYNSPVNKKPFYILLDVLFENNHYARIVDKQIRNDLLIHEPDYYSVKVPSVACVLADKLTAFAPHTTGIPLNKGKDMEVIKQFYDVCSLIDVLSDFDEIMPTYEQIAKTEIGYRGISADAKDCLKDTYNTAFCLATRGKVMPEEYPLLVKGVRNLRGHIYSERFTPEIAAFEAVKVMYFALCLLVGERFEAVDDAGIYLDAKISSGELKPLKSLRKLNPKAYAYAIKIDRLIEK